MTVGAVLKIIFALLKKPHMQIYIVINMLTNAGLGASGLASNYLIDRLKYSKDKMFFFSTFFFPLEIVFSAYAGYFGKDKPIVMAI